MVRQAGLPFAALASLGHDWSIWERAWQTAEAQWQESTAALQRAFDEALSQLPETPLRTAVYNARKDFYQRQRLPAEAACTAWESQSTTVALAMAVATARQAKEQKEAVEKTFFKEYKAVLLRNYRYVQQLATAADFQRALLFCSHELLARLPLWLEKEAAHFSKKDRQTAFSALKYLTRMATRTTPLSRLATVALGNASEEVFPLEKTVVTPDSALLPLLYEVLLQEPAFYQTMSVRLNPCITAPALEQYTWVFFDGTDERIQQAPATESLQYVASQLLARRGSAEGFKSFCQQIAEASEQPFEIAERYLCHLIEQGFLEWILPVSGLSPRWCDELYRYLAFLPATPRVTETIEVLNWLRHVARNLPYLSLSEATENQRKSAEYIRQYVERWGVSCPDLQPERIFYEDVASPSAPPPLVEDLLDELAEVYGQCQPSSLPAERHTFLAFAQTQLSSGRPKSFLSLASAFLQQKAAVNESAAIGLSLPKALRIGVLFQISEENGQPYAALNALYPGGGKLFARWLHLLPTALTEALQAWLQPTPDEPALAAFPWQGFSNANLQPSLTHFGVEMPGGRVTPMTGGLVIKLGQIAVEADENGVLRLLDSVTGCPLVLTDLGLEAAESRPPVVRLLWQTGVPYVSRRVLLPREHQPILLEEGVQHRPRYRQGRWVLARASWLIEQAYWVRWVSPSRDKNDAQLFWLLRTDLRRLGVPRYFSARWEHPEEPAFFDADSPVFLALFLRQLRRHSGSLHLSEYWPLPNERAQEWVMEFHRVE